MRKGADAPSPILCQRARGMLELPARAAGQGSLRDGLPQVVGRSRQNPTWPETSPPPASSCSGCICASAAACCCWYSRSICSRFCIGQRTDARQLLGHVKRSRRASSRKLEGFGLVFRQRIALCIAAGSPRPSADVPASPGVLRHLPSICCSSRTCFSIWRMFSGRAARSLCHIGVRWPVDWFVTFLTGRHRPRRPIRRSVGPCSAGRSRGMQAPDIPGLLGIGAGRRNVPQDRR